MISHGIKLKASVPCTRLGRRNSILKGHSSIVCTETTVPKATVLNTRNFGRIACGHSHVLGDVI